MHLLPSGKFALHVKGLKRPFLEETLLPFRGGKILMGNELSHQRTYLRLLFVDLGSMKAVKYHRLFGTRAVKLC